MTRRDDEQPRRPLPDTGRGEEAAGGSADDVGQPDTFGQALRDQLQARRRVLTADEDGRLRVGPAISPEHRTERRVVRLSNGRFSIADVPDDAA